MSTTTTNTILLRPRPYAQYAGRFMLVALLPPPKPLPALPVEIWGAIFSWVTELNDLWGLDLASPLFYARVKLSRFPAFEKFLTRLAVADQNWSPIHRTPFSSPGRWVQALDLSAISVDRLATDALALDSLLVNLFPLTPFLARLSLNPAFVLSRRVLESLGQSFCAGSLKSLEGVAYVPSEELNEPLTRLLRCCINLEELEIIGHGLDPAEMPDPAAAAGLLPQPEFLTPLHLPHLRTLLILSVHSSPLLFILQHSALPALQKLTITPYEDVPSALSSPFIQTHGEKLRSLLLFTPKSWPTRLHPSPPTLLCTSPSLNHLSLERPLPRALQLPQSHSLQILSIPRPDTDFYFVFERILSAGKLPSLRAVRARDVRWLRKGMGDRAQATGVQGEMMEWRRRLQRRGVRMLDGDWKEYEA
ncbi:F-box domain-containing protein [Mycena chlorophos]|uniref:F-box domain-containing protein n=1 Tax=Mycena chlorophos TaxID=658473 RepID=A0A8H6SQI3_MYCCL|nr:F-box domain-containing protein [Mycena chlorophos]